MIDQELIIPGVKLESANRDLRGVTRQAMFGRASRAKDQRCGVATMCWAKFGAPPVPPLTITITRVGPRELDGDNLAASAKHCRDGVSDWLSVNDRDKRLRWEYEQESNGKVYAVKIRVQTWAQTFDEFLRCDKAYMALGKKTSKALQDCLPGFAKMNERLAAMCRSLRAEWEAGQ